MTKEENEKRLAYLKNIVLNMPEKPGSYQYYDDLRENGGTIPEELPTPQVSIKQLENSVKITEKK